jgi:preprotein translocase subunit SecG
LNYNLEGNYFDENSAVVYHSQAVLVFGMLALLFLICSLIFVYLTIKSLKNQKKSKSN